MNLLKLFFIVALLSLALVTVAIGQTVTYTHNLTWQDNSDNEDGFKIERRTTTGTFSEVAQVGQNINTYSDVLTDGQERCFKVRAYKATDCHGNFRWDYEPGLT